MTDHQAQCRAALLTACRVMYDWRDVGDSAGHQVKDLALISVDDAAACMAAREAKLMAELGAAGARNARSKVRETKLREALRRLLEVIDRCGDIDGVALGDWLDTPDNPHPGGIVTEARAALAAAQEKP